MRNDLKRRLRAVEIARSGGVEMWVEQEDGMVRSLDNEQIVTREEAEARARVTRSILIFCSETDARL